MNISEIFYSIEGEGIQIGRPEIFVRLSGCNLKCVWCDTKYSLKIGKTLEPERILEEIKKYPCKSVSITGGEPLLQSAELLDLIKKLRALSYWISINTNGTILNESVFDLLDLISMDCKCPSSRMSSNEAVLEETKEFYDQKTQFKFVISDQIDYTYAKNILSRLKPNFAVFQTNWKNKDFIKELIELVKIDGLSARVILQQHKLIWGVTKGV